MSIRIIKRNLPRQKPARAQHYAAERWEPNVLEGFHRSVRIARRSFDMPTIRAALVRGRLAIANQSLPWAEFAAALERHVLPSLKNAMLDGSGAAVRDLRTRKIAKAGPPDELRIGLDLLFDLDNPRVRMWLGAHGARLVRDIRDSTMLAIRAIAVEAQRRGLGVTEQADKIAAELRRGFGLNQNQGRWLANFETGLIEQGISPGIITTRVEEYRDRLLNSRARTIARHETMTASNVGQQEVWMQATEQGFLDPNQKRKWITQPSLNMNNPCPICAPMDGQVRGMNEEFVSPHNGARAMQPPIHISCQCVPVLYFEDE